ncbi:MAG: sce7726 family protein [Thermoleophilaceae bacterium]|nr:sce7726 family protein [Thermoleophilaceae bacterium]
MVDRDIRAALDGVLQAAHDDDPETLVLDELGVCEGEARVDLAVINGAIAGFEIKSDRDTLTRLPRQVVAYNRVFDYVTIIVGERYRRSARSLVPRWWGIMLASDADDGVELAPVRQARRNRAVEPYAVAQLLWREEALKLLEVYDLAGGVRSKPRHVLWRRLAGELSGDVLAREVRERLRARAGWRSVPPPLPGGD